MKNTIPIFFAINEEYIDHCCTSIVSILENNRSLNISIYILTDCISLESKELLQEIENVFTCVTIQWEIIDSESFKQLKKNRLYFVRKQRTPSGNRKCIYLCNYPMGDNRFRIIQATQEKRRIHHRTHSLSLCHRRSFSQSG